MYFDTFSGLEFEKIFNASQRNIYMECMWLKKCNTSDFLDIHWN